MRLHQQDRLLNKSLAHDTSMQIGRLANSLICRQASVWIITGLPIDVIWPPLSQS
jgi:hypothetical protein